MNGLTSGEILSLVLIWFSILLVSKKLTANWFNPVTLVAALWAFVMCFSVFTGGPYYFSYAALIFLVGMILSFVTGWLLSLPKEKYLTVHLPAKQLDNNILKWTQFIGIMGGCLAFFLLIEPALQQVAEGGLSRSIANLSATLSRDRYEGKRLSAMIMIGLMFNNVACLSGGRLISIASNWKDRLLAVLPLASLLLFALVYTSRSVFLYGLMLFLATASIYFSVRLKEQQIKWKWVAGGSVGVLILFLLFVFSQALRMGIDLLSMEAFTRVFTYLRVWFAGNISSFCIWFDQPGAIIDTQMGRLTFGGLAELLGKTYRVPGVYTVSYDVSGHLEVTNIYTLFRFLCDDFGLAGAFLFLFVIGLLSGALYERFKRGSHLAAALLSLVLAGMFFSFIASLWAYNSLFIAWVIYVLIHFLSIPVDTRVKQ